jgi:hypothetical protein
MPTRENKNVRRLINTNPPSMSKTGYAPSPDTVSATDYFLRSREEMPSVLSNGHRWVFVILYAKGNDWGCVYFEPRLVISST